jgi:PilZ domain-containing protein
MAATWADWLRLRLALLLRSASMKAIADPAGGVRRSLGAMARRPFRGWPGNGRGLPELRRYPRYAIAATSEAGVLPGERRVDGRVTVISRSGCFFRASDAFLPGITLQVKIQWRGASLESWARVAHAVVGSGMGLAFLRMGDSQTEILNQWLEELASSGGAIE